MRTEEREEQERRKSRECRTSGTNKKIRDSGASRMSGKRTEGKGAPADQGKKLRRGRLIFRKEGTTGFIERLALSPDVVNSKDRRISKGDLAFSQIVQVLLLHGVEK